MSTQEEKTGNGRSRGQRAMRLCLGLAGGAGLVAFVLLFPIMSERSLLRAATRHFALNAYDKTFWLSDHEALVIHNTPNQAARATRMDISTGLETPCTLLNQVLLRADPNSEMHLSPDGKWLLWTAIAGMRPKRYFATEVTALDNSRNIERRDGAHLIWTRDSQAWLRFRREGQQLRIERQTLESPRVTAVSTDEPEMPAMPRVSRPFPSLPQLDNTDALGMTPDDRLVYVSRKITEGLPTVCYELDATGSGRPSQAGRIPPPVPGTFGAVALAPQGDCLAWIIHDKWFSSGGVLQSLGRHWPTLTRIALFDMRPRRHAWIYVSRRDGSDMRCLGSAEEISYTTVPGVPPYAEQRLENLQWLPDGQHLSFVYKHELYTMPSH